MIKKLLHYDSREFNKGDIIIGNKYDLSDSIVSAYRNILPLYPASSSCVCLKISSDIDTILYCTDDFHEMWDYDNVYMVQVDDSQLHICRTDCSPVLCSVEVNRCTRWFRHKFNGRSEEVVDVIRRSYFEYIAQENYLFFNPTSCSDDDLIKNHFINLMSKLYDITSPDDSYNLENMKYYFNYNVSNELEYIVPCARVTSRMQLKGVE